MMQLAVDDERNELEEPSSLGAHLCRCPETPSILSALHISECLFLHVSLAICGENPCSIMFILVDVDTYDRKVAIAGTLLIHLIQVERIGSDYRILIYNASLGVIMRSKSTSPSLYHKHLLHYPHMSFLELSFSETAKGIFPLIVNSTSSLYGKLTKINISGLHCHFPLMIFLKHSLSLQFSCNSLEEIRRPDS